MKNILISILILTSLSSYAQLCLEGKVVTDLSQLDVDAICETKQQLYIEAKDTFDQVFSQIDMTNMEDQKLWALVLGPQQSYLVEKAQNDMNYCSDCSRDAHLFYKCGAYKDINQEATLSYKTEYLKLNLLDRADQIRWQEIEPALNAKVKSSSIAYRHCQTT